MKVREARQHNCQMKSGNYSMLFLKTAIFFLMIPLLNSIFNHEPRDDMPHHEVKHWAQLLGTHVFTLLNSVSNYKEIEGNFRAHGASIADNDGLALVKQMAEDINNMMKYKVQAVKRIMNVAEEVSQDASYLDENWLGYFNSKLINRGDDFAEELRSRYGNRFSSYYGTNASKFFNLKLKPNSHFDYTPISLNVSTVHVPTNVFEGGPNVKKAIRWSEALEKTFYSNYEHDPTLSWQFFGSSAGFLRQFPGSAWNMEAEDPDLYDARLRPWYIQAANTPKDMIILLDVSGSMTGLRKEIAKHVVMNILDTLNENDFFNVIIFNDKTKGLIECLNATLVQANLENIGDFKLALESLETKEIADFEKALTKAFELLQKHDSQGYGAQCNQDIMLVTDGAPDNYQKVFEEKNWPQIQIRLFTYLIGREVTEKRYLQWMACTNKGYFVHVTTPSEVKEQVLKYIPVIARPMVMYQDRHPIIWTGVYADIAMAMSPIKILRSFEMTYIDPGRRLDPDSPHGYTLMTTVSVPVFNRTQKVITVADLLGVAGTDVPIREIRKLAPAYKIGVNGYSFMVNKNGFVLYHPDLRPTFQDILKPNYNSVDLTEVELTDDADNPRMNATGDLHILRRDMIDQRGAETRFRVRTHLDQMKRVVIRDQWYYTAEVPETPFSLGIAMPQGYGKFKVVGEIELSLAVKDNPKFNASNYFRHGKWSLHPEWVYCEYKYDQGVKRTPEELFQHFLEKAQMRGWKWRSTRTRPPPDTAQVPRGMPNHYDGSEYYCDKTLIQSLLFDAKATDVFGNPKKKKIDADGNDEAYERFGITTAFVATRSGLTRWLDWKNISNGEDESNKFMKQQKRSIDEVWYKRAVDYYNEDSEAYVYSVPYDAGTSDPSKVFITASRAIFVKKNKYHQAPAAVVGVNIQLDKFISFFKNQTYNCRDFSRQSVCDEKRTCGSDSLDCYLVDNNGFVIASEKDRDVGKFFGKIEGSIMTSLVSNEVYRRIVVFDYQAVCLDSIKEENFASLLLNPLQTLKWIFQWIMGNIMWILVRTELYQLWDPNYIYSYSEGIDDSDPMYKTDYNNHMPGVEPDDYSTGEIPSNVPHGEPPEHEEDTLKKEMAFINKTRPRHCDKIMTLFVLNTTKLKEPESNKFTPVKGKLSNCHQDGCTKPFCIQKVIQTNLVLIVVHNECQCEQRDVEIEPQEVCYSDDEICERQKARHFRDRPKTCLNYHPDEATIKDCGAGSEVIKPSIKVLAYFIFAHLTYTHLLKT